MGRSAKDTTVDIDFSLEGPAWKISRKQGSIKVDNNGDFFIINEGKKPIFVDGKPVLQGNKSKISTNSVIEVNVKQTIIHNLGHISGCVFIFILVLDFIKLLLKFLNCIFKLFFNL